MKQTTYVKGIFNDEHMLEALAEAQKAYEKEEIPVGCVIASKETGEVVARAHNRMQELHNSNLHAEIIAINIACEKLGSKNLADYDLYVTLEPCTMCASAISNARISRVYYGASDEKQGAVENGVRFYQSKSCMHKPEIYSGIHKEEAENLMLRFFEELRKK